MTAAITLDAAEKREILHAAGIDPSEPLLGSTDGTDWYANGPELAVTTPIDGSELATVRQASAEDYERTVRAAQAAFEAWATLPAPKRGEIVRQMGERLRRDKDALGRLVTLENGKILSEGLGEVQEMIDIADFAVGLSRQLYGKTMQSERPDHRMYEQWHPLGVVGVISAFNFPVAVWSWNAFIAGVCGDTLLWKPSSSTPLTALAVSRAMNEVLADHGHEGVMTLCVGRGSEVGDRLTADRRVPLVSATGSCAMGFTVAEAVSKRLGRTILELGGNNAILVTPSAELALAERAALFAAVGTAGQRCTSLRRLIVHEDVADELVGRLADSYERINIGSPLDEDVLMGPLIDEKAVATMMEALGHIEKQGGEVVAGGKQLSELGPNYVQPTIVNATADMPIVADETFAPILYVLRYRDRDESIAMHNSVPQGLSSACFTNDVREAERFLSVIGSDCGIANINIGTSGAEIAGAFGGEKETGGGREAGSDSWKQYMRRQTVTINYGTELPLAQGVSFDV